eukprot:TRINITY_DN7556_c0_g1_i1.p1 TRINITY_DN7556_c0_g1~~TRINITY_DN7556_c0_g1_i1.p1  ORF type:complete len:505 (-),score=68.74 TRINITY_DN7556_c0_g1_i1:256-1737(-)
MNPRSQWLPLLAFCCGAALVLTLVGCGGGGGGHSCTPQVMSAPCNASQIRGQCSKCTCMGLEGKCIGPVGCSACKSPYVWQRSTPPDARVQDGSCSIECPPAAARPRAPKDALDLNGIAWPEACWNDTDQPHFFIIGDWGGVFGDPPQTFQNRPTIVPPIDKTAQVFVAGIMAKIARISRPKFIANVGDNFYPGGIGAPGSCNANTGKTDASGSIVFNGVFEKIYQGEGIDGVEWWGVLGNHDYGGYHYSVHWDQNVFYTWHSETSRWLTPALYWSRRVQFRDFAADFYFVDTNLADAKAPPVDPEHNICSGLHNQAPPLKPQDLVCNGTSIRSPSTCLAFFQQLWNDQKAWLKKGLGASDAEWQIIVTHYPPTFEPCMSDAWKHYFGDYGVDLYISGHTHQQSAYYKDAETTKLFGDTAYVISGGGGGITSEILPDVNGNDDAYGFVDVTITKDHIKLVRYSHGGIEKKAIVRGTTLVAPRSRSTPQDLTII